MAAGCAAWLLWRPLIVALSLGSFHAGLAALGTSITVAFIARASQRSYGGLPARLAASKIIKPTHLIGGQSSLSFAASAR